MVARDGVPSLISAIGRSAPQVSISAKRQLTPREREVLTLMSDGGTNRQIAARLEISEQSVKNHISNLLRKLGARNRTEAAAVARRDGLIA
jgi:DNA-binding NarL/FixJ family response regulator